jgi:hypothetical protein
MVSNAVQMSLEELVAALQRIRREWGQSEEYRKWRDELPTEWPL